MIVELGYVLDAEQVQINRIDKLVGGKDTTVATTEDKKAVEAKKVVVAKTNSKTGTPWLDIALKEKGQKEIKLMSLYRKIPVGTQIASGVFLKRLRRSRSIKKK